MAGALTYLQLKLGLGATALDLPQPVSKLCQNPGNKLASSTAKTLDHKSKESSFYIWLARNSRCWYQNAIDLIDSSNQPQPSHSAKSVFPNSKKPLPSKATIPVKPPIPVMCRSHQQRQHVLCKFYLARFESHSNHVVSMDIRVFFSVPTCQIHCP